MDEKERLDIDETINPDDINLDVEQPTTEAPTEEIKIQDELSEQTQEQPEAIPASNEQPAEETPPIEDEVLLPAEAASLHQQPTPKKGGHKKAVIIIVLILLFAIVGGAIAWTVLQKDDTQTSQEPQKSTVVLMGAELTIADGIAQTSTDNKTWSEAQVGDQITEGVYIKTSEEGRAVIALDDGSAVRINSNSVVKFESLDTTNVVIINESGQVYTRVVPSERQFSVLVNDEAFKAMGTAYVTVNTEETQGVEVYESTVKVTSSDTDVPEGKYYYIASKQPGNNQQVVTDIPVDKVKQDAFLAWNYEQDKNNSEFSKKLGYLTKIDEPVAPVATPAAEAPKPDTSASITLTGSAYDTGVKLKWTLANSTAPKGFKVVKSLSANPTFGKDDAQYVSDPNARSYAWTIKDGKTYHFRVCVYTGDGCTTYSNDITVKAPKIEQVSETPTGTLTLTNSGGKNFSWVLNGKAPYGYKLVWSKTVTPVYPAGSTDSDYSFYSSQSTLSGAMKDTTPSGTYNVRVCMYNNGSCLNYSNQLTVTIPATP